MATKPSNIAEWGTGAAPIVEPTTPQKQAGWAVAFKPPAQWFNWWMKLVHLWIVWLDAFESEAHTWSAFQTFASFENTTTAIFNGATSVNGPLTLDSSSTATVERSLDFTLGAVDTPLLTRNGTATNPNLLFRQDVAGALVMRMYSQVTRGLIVTYNARWDPGTSNWVKDAAGNAWMMTLGKGVRHYQAPAAAPPFADASWVEVFNTWREGDGQAGLPSGNLWYGRTANDGVVEYGRHVPQLAWTNLTLSANLTAVVGDEPQYYKDTTGRVWMRGVATSNTTIVSGSQIGTLPVTAGIERPMTLPQVIVGATPNMQIVLQTSGRIDLQVGSPGNIGTGVPINFANISYRAV